MWLKSNDVRVLRDKFWIQRGHKESTPSSLIPSSEDKTVIFNVAGMQPLVPYLTGKEHPDGKRLYNIQRCIRTNDIEDIGDERHCTFFEMMGNRSLWDYFKKESMERSIQFLTETVWLSKEKIWCSIFWWLVDKDGNELVPYDQEAEDILTQNGIPLERIKAIGMVLGTKCDNRRGPAGAVWPCWPSAEFHYDRGEQRGPNDWNIWENDRFIEIWNNVFMEYYKDSDGNFSPLSQKNIDTGMGLERLMMIIENADTVFETDLFLPIIQYIEEISQTKYPALHKKSSELSNKEQDTTRSFRIISDHIRSISLLIMDWVIPSNESRGYVCRRLIRRMFYHLSKLYQNIDELNTESILHKKISWLIHIIVSQYKEAYPELVREQKNIITTLTKEITHFQSTIKKWRKLLDEYMQASTNKVLIWADVFKLYDTFGFPIELTKEIAQEEWYTIDEEGFEKKMHEARELAKQTSQNKFRKDVDRASYLEGVPPTNFVGRDWLENSSMKIIKDIDISWQRVLIFDITPFYAEWWGQTWDTWTITTDEGEKLNVTTVKKYGGVYLHFVE